MFNNTYSQNISEDKGIIFLQLVDKYTLLHIQIIRYLHDVYMKQTFFNNIELSYMAMFRLKFYKVDDTYLKKSIKDLQNDYLVESFSDDAPVGFKNRRIELLTKLGNDFYDYLKSDEDKNENDYL